MIESIKINFNELTGPDILKLHSAIRILLVVATDVELFAALSCMKPLPESEMLSKFYQGTQTYYLGIVGCFPVCLVKTTMMGSLKRDASFSTVTDALDFWNVKIVIMPGIAFGRDKDKQSIGDILISETLSQYETVKEDAEAGVITRGHSVPCSSVLLNRFSQDSHWINPDTGERVNIIRCELLSGEKLVNDNATKIRLFDRFLNARGGEMEGNGVYAACDKKKVDWIICKSICDWGDGQKNYDW